MFNTRQHNLHTEQTISHEHISNNQSVRNLLLERGVKPEDLPPEEDVKKLERRVNKDSKKLFKNPEKLEDKGNE